MPDRSYLYSGEESWNAGEQKDLCWDGGLCLREDCFTGCWLGPVQAFADLDRLALSWNAAVPLGAGVRVSARVQVDGAWTPWLDWGLWSPLCDAHRQPPKLAACAGARLRDGVLCLDKAGEAFQLQAELTANDVGESPLLYLLAASPMAAVGLAPDEGEPLYHRCIPVPAYSQQTRDPRLAGHIGGAVCATMLMNRWGEDLLPEKVAHSCRDWAGSWEDPAYLAATVSLYGYEALAVHCGVAALKKEIKSGCASAALLGDAAPRWVVVRGFDTDADQVQQVLLNDPDADSDTAAETVMDLADFAAAWTGLALLVHPKDEAKAPCAPGRGVGELRPSELPGAWTLLRKGERVSLPVDLCVQGGVCRGTVCYTVKDGRAYASNAHKRFFYTDVSAAGDILLDTAAMPAGTHLSVYVIQPEQTTAACLTL